MALITSGRIGPLRGTFYTLLNNITRDKITGQITGKVISYGSEESRREHGRVSAAYWPKVKARIAAQKALDALKPADGDNASELARKTSASVAARAALELAQAEEKVAKLALDSAKEEIGGPSLDFEISPADTADYLTEDGQIDMAALYERIKTLPGFADAIDAK